ncbi:hypothetical protein FIBSPDRAFT_887211 [Athelia psychrophila]|uniref:Uncharacterized protein n=1 Tax=Athelia psychrophila TaxID=1759441 RepID=A0A166PSV7_9AGAM|nr:hypothetical protein FIBSPDRAFT_887211 [Fibularhizoctonia sp. CBS 109695]
MSKKLRQRPQPPKLESAAQRVKARLGSGSALSAAKSVRDRERVKERVDVVAEDEIACCAVSIAKREIRSGNKMIALAWGFEHVTVIGAVSVGKEEGCWCLLSALTDPSTDGIAELVPLDEIGEVGGKHRLRDVWDKKARLTPVMRVGVKRIGDPVPVH